MTQGEYERIKNEEKEHLKALRALKKTLRSAKRASHARKRAKEIELSTDALLETHDEMVRRLTFETAHDEARIEMALDAAGNDAVDLPGQTLDAAGGDAVDLPGTKNVSHQAPRNEGNEPPPRWEKTIGRM